MLIRVIATYEKSNKKLLNIEVDEISLNNNDKGHDKKPLNHTPDSAEWNCKFDKFFFMQQDMSTIKNTIVKYNSELFFDCSANQVSELKSKIIEAFQLKKDEEEADVQLKETCDYEIHGELDASNFLDDKVPGFLLEIEKELKNIFGTNADYKFKELGIALIDSREKDNKRYKGNMRVICNGKIAKGDQIGNIEIKFAPVKAEKNNDNKNNSELPIVPDIVIDLHVYAIPSANQSSSIQYKYKDAQHYVMLLNDLKDLDKSNIKGPTLIKVLDKTCSYYFCQDSKSEPVILKTCNNCAVLLSWAKELKKKNEKFFRKELQITENKESIFKEIQQGLDFLKINESNKEIEQKEPQKEMQTVEEQMQVVKNEFKKKEIKERILEIATLSLAEVDNVYFSKVGAIYNVAPDSVGQYSIYLQQRYFKKNTERYESLEKKIDEKFKEFEVILNKTQEQFKKLPLLDQNQKKEDEKEESQKYVSNNKNAFCNNNQQSTIGNLMQQKESDKKTEKK